MDYAWSNPPRLVIVNILTFLITKLQALQSLPRTVLIWIISRQLGMHYPDPSTYSV